MEEVNKLGLKHINYALVEKTRPMMYKAMKYWGKKPNNLFRAYIEHYSNPNEIVLDAFAGSGVCPLEAIQTGRKAIAVDLNPIAIFITKMLATPLDIAKLLNRKIKEPMFKNTFILDKWRVASYEELEKLFKEKEINEESFDAIFSQVLKVKEGIQSKLS